LNHLHPVDFQVAAKEDYRRSILNDLLYYFKGPYAMLSAFIDESGTHKGAIRTCVAGLLYDEKNLKGLDSAWKEALEQVGIEYFHAKDSSALRGQFKGWERKKEGEFWTRLIGLIKNHAPGGAIAYITEEDQFDAYRKSHSWEYSQYTTCAFACIELLFEVARKLGDDHVDFTIESGHKKMGELNTLLMKLRESGMAGSYGFRDKKDSRPLQSADLWAYEARKRLTDQLQENPRTLRKSFRVLIEDNPNMMQIPLNSETLPNLFSEVGKLLGSEPSAG
jgi:hypothetical protein